MTSMHRLAKFLLALTLTVLSATSGLSQQMAVGTFDELALMISEKGTIETLSVDGQDLLAGDVGACFPLSVCDVTRGEEFVPAEGEAVATDGGSVVQQTTMDDISLRLAARYEAYGEMIRVRLSVGDTSGGDRGLLVRFALPVAAEGWRWWDDMDSTRTIGETGTYERSRGIREFAALPEWRDKPALRMGSHSVNFCNVISGPVGLSYAVPLDQPRIFRTGYDADQGLFYIVYDVALARETEPPGAAEMTFYLYRCDPKWGMRSALDRYYRRFPEFFTKHVKKEPMWMAFSRLSRIDNANEFRFVFQEGAPEPGYDDELDAYSLTYFTHAGQFANIPDYDPETDAEPSYERQLAAMRAKFKSSTGKAEIFDASGLYDPEGRLSIKRTAVYGHIIAQYNLDPGLPYGKHMLGSMPSVFESYRERRGGELDGFYYDGITTGINYRREHFRWAGYPPIWDPVRKKPFLYNYFSSAEFAREVAEQLHAEGKITMMNGAMGSSFYTAPYLDVMGAETGLRIDRSSFNYVRTICHKKPFVTLLKGNFSQLTGEEIALFMKRCVAYGVFPGFFDWPPSGLGPGSRYWDHAEWYERDRMNHRKYQTLCQRLARAGWEPLTLARGSDPGLAVERFGGTEDKEVFFTVLNDVAGAVDTVISIPAEALPPEPVVVDEVTLRWLGDATIKGGQLEVPLSLEGESLAVLHVASKEQLFQRQADEVLANLALRSRMARIDADRPQSLVHWPASRGRYQRDDVDGRSLLKLANESTGQTTGATQWVMLYQETAEPLKLRIRLKCDGVTPGSQGQLVANAILCHVNKKTRFTERARKQFELPSGTYGKRDHEITIVPERPLRSIQLTVNLERCSGTVWIEKISVTPASDPTHEYAVDPKLDEWYEPLTTLRRHELDLRFAVLEAEVKRLRDAKSGAVADACLSILDRAAEHRKWIDDNGLANPARRALRELDDLTARLSSVASMRLGVRGLDVDAPTVAVPGEEIDVVVRTVGVEEREVDCALEASPGWSSKDAVGGRFTLTVPHDALATTGRLTLTAAVTSPSGRTLRLERRASVRVVPVIEAAMRVGDVSASGEEVRLAIDCTNNGPAAVEVAIEAELPPGWRWGAAPEKWSIGPKSEKRIELAALPSPETKPGRYVFRVKLCSSKLTTPLEFSQTVFFLPESLNLLKNPGFEAGAVNWA